MIMPEKISCLKDNEQNLSGEDIREGLTAIISVKIEDPQFEGQTKQKLGNSEARGAVDSVVSSQLEIYLEQNPAGGQDHRGEIYPVSESQRCRPERRERTDPEEICSGRNVLCQASWRTV